MTFQQQISGKLMFGKATVTLSDVTAGNGVVHAIDEVLFAAPERKIVAADQVSILRISISAENFSNNLKFCLNFH
jgi:hypothetical protein